MPRTAPRPRISSLSRFRQARIFRMTDLNRFNLTVGKLTAESSIQGLEQKTARNARRRPDGGRPIKGSPSRQTKGTPLLLPPTSIGRTCRVVNKVRSGFVHKSSRPIARSAEVGKQDGTA